MAYNDPTVISRGVSGTFGDVQYTGTGDTTGTIDKDFTSLLPPAETASPPVAFSLVEGKAGVARGLDRSLLSRAKDIIGSFNHSDVMDATINLESLRGIVLQLWESARKSTQFHQEILAILEAAILSAESPTDTQLSVFKEAVTDLANDVLTQAHVDVIRRRFIGEGFSPLAVLTEVEDGDDSDS